MRVGPSISQHGEVNSVQNGEANTSRTRDIRQATGIKRGAAMLRRGHWDYTDQAADVKHPLKGALAETFVQLRKPAS